MIYVQADTFTIGSDDGNVQFPESPAHQVTLTKDYLMGETEVTEALWSAVMVGGSHYHHFGSKPYLFTTTGRYFYGSTDWTIGFRISLQ